MNLRLPISRWLLLFSWSASALAASEAPITDVLLYPGGATVFRSVKVAPGSGVIAIPGLPASFDANTLRIEAGAGLRVGETVIRDLTRTQASNPREAEIEARIQALQDQQGALDAEARAAEVVKDYLGRIGGSGPIGGPAAPLDAKTITAQADAIGHVASESLGKVQRLEVQKRELERNIQALKANLAKLRTGDRNTRELSINVTAAKEGALKVSYQVRNAGWRPTYRGELLSATGVVELERLAVVSQRTGEDWVNARIVLSTIQPNNAPAGPDPQPWLLSYYPPQVAGTVPMAKLAAAPAMAPAPMRSRALMQPGEEADYTPPTFETQSTFATEFEVPVRLSIPSDGRDVSIQLAKYQQPVKHHVRVTPRLHLLAFVVAEGERPQGVWPSGPIQLFRDGNFVGSGQWNLADKERFTLSFGRDDLVRVSNQPVKQDKSSSGVFDKKNELHLSHLFTVANNHPGPVDIEVLETMPVATSEEIKVRSTLDPKPGIDNWNGQRGVVAWTATVQRNASAKFSVDYVIESPKDGSVLGMR